MTTATIACHWSAATDGKATMGLAGWGTCHVPLCSTIHNKWNEKRVVCTTCANKQVVHVINHTLITGLVSVPHVTCRHTSAFLRRRASMRPTRSSMTRSLAVSTTWSYFTFTGWQVKHVHMMSKLLVQCFDSEVKSDVSSRVSIQLSSQCAASCKSKNNNNNSSSPHLSLVHISAKITALVHTTQQDIITTLNTPCFIKNWTLCYFIISLLWQLRIAWKFPEVHKRCCLLWIHRVTVT